MKKKSKPKYLTKDKLEIIILASKKIVAIRNETLKQVGIDILDTDAISSSFLYEIVSQYDIDYNVNFARNGEDAKSNGIIIEQKATRVDGALTPTGKKRKNYGIDAAFQFHAMGDLEYPRYIFAARNKATLEIDRIYDISNPSNCANILQYLLNERNLWLARTASDQKKMKRDIILLPEKYLLENIQFSPKTVIVDCTVFRD
jgi:hypothetical protein